jgi:hypothetical protein
VPEATRHRKAQGNVENGSRIFYSGYVLLHASLIYTPTNPYYNKTTGMSPDRPNFRLRRTIITASSAAMQAIHTFVPDSNSNVRYSHSAAANRALSFSASKELFHTKGCFAYSRAVRSAVTAWMHAGTVYAGTVLILASISLPLPVLIPRRSWSRASSSSINSLAPFNSGLHIQVGSQSTQYCTTPSIVLLPMMLRISHKPS